MTNMDNVKEFLMPAPHEPGKWESFGLGIIMGALVTKMGYELAPIVKGRSRNINCGIIRKIRNNMAGTYGSPLLSQKKIKKSWDKNNVEIKLITFLQKFN